MLMQAVAEQESKLRMEQARDRRKSSFRAAPPPRFPQPPPPARSERPATRALTPKLAVETRSTARAAFDAMVAENKRKEEADLSHIFNCMPLVLSTFSQIASCVLFMVCLAIAQSATVLAVRGTFWKVSHHRMASSSMSLWDGVRAPDIRGHIAV